MTEVRRLFVVGVDDAVAAALGEGLGRTPVRGWPADPTSDDVVFLQAAAPTGAAGEWAEVPGGNAFAAARSVKARGPARVFLVVRPDDPVSPEIARFCLADGCVTAADGKLLGDVAELRAILTPHRPRVSVDELLARLESRMTQEGRESVVRRLLDPREGMGLLGPLTDPETGLWDGRFASVKLDEEFKRAVRFHQPLSLILLDIGSESALPSVVEDRRIALAEVAGVFLNECRDIDVLSRFTPTVFLFLLPGTGSDGAAVVAQRMLSSLREREFHTGLRLQPYAGLVTAPGAGIRDREAFLVRAEACLELAREGRGAGGLCRDRD